MSDGLPSLAGPSKAATIYDIARVAQVSPSTVSRALSTPGRLNAKTEARIRQVAQDLNFHKNPLASALPTGRSDMLGVLVSDLTNPVFFEMVRGADRSAQAAGNTMMLSESQESAEREKETARRMLSVVDGLILSSSRQSDEDIYQLSQIKPLVVVNRCVPKVLSIVPDLEPGINDLMDRIKAAGHTRICYLAGPQESWMNTARRTALATAAANRRLAFEVLESQEPTVAGGSGQLSRVQTAKATVVIAFNDLMAIGLMRAAIATGVDVPAELSVIGFDDIFGAELTSPELTTVRAPLGGLGEFAVTELLALVGRQNVISEPNEIRFGVTELVLRGSAHL